MRDGRSTGAPVVVAFSLVTTYSGGARQFGFMLRGLREMEATLRAKNIEFVLLEGDPERLSRSSPPTSTPASSSSTSPRSDSVAGGAKQWRPPSRAPCTRLTRTTSFPCGKPPLSSRWARARFAGNSPSSIPSFSSSSPNSRDEGRVRREGGGGGGENRPHDWDAVIDDAVARGAAVPEVSWAVPAKPPREPLDGARRLRLYENRNVTPSRRRSGSRRTCTSGTFQPRGARWSEEVLQIGVQGGGEFLRGARRASRAGG